MEVLQDEKGLFARPIKVQWKEVCGQESKVFIWAGGAIPQSHRKYHNGFQGMDYIEEKSLTKVDKGFRMVDSTDWLGW